MKTTSIINRCAILVIAVSFAICGPIRADREIFMKGTVRSFEPKTFVIQSESVPEPVTYISSVTTRFTDESGEVVTRETITPGTPVTVYYMRDGDKLVASRVVIHKTTTTTTTTVPGRPLTKKEAKDLREARDHPEREAKRAAEKGKPFPPPDPSQPTTVTTTTEGTVSSLAPEEFVIKTTTTEGPITYRYTKTTQYVDELGEPVAMEVVKTGVPITVTYVREGDRLIAQRVVVHQRTVVRP